jgi:ABC-type nitrate/sulfonate/bicarbonate transport system permease component
VVEYEQESTRKTTLSGKWRLGQESFFDFLDRHTWFTASLLVLVLALLWQFMAYLIADQRLFPDPIAVFRAGIRLISSGELLSEIGVTLYELAAGYLPAVTLGILVAAVIHYVPLLNRLFGALFLLLYNTPYVVLLPVFVLWFGIGPASKIMTVAYASFFPVYFTTLRGLATVDPLLVQVVRSFGGNRSNIATKVVVPYILPSIASGLRQSMGRAIIAVIVAEMFIAVLGLGALLNKYALSLNTANLIFIILVTATLGYIVVTLMRLFETNISRWRMESRE